MNLRPSGYEPDELPGCSTPRQKLRRSICRSTDSQLRSKGRRVPRRKALLQAPNRQKLSEAHVKRRSWFVLGRPGSDLLSRVLRRSTIGAGVFHGRVRNGIGCSHPAITTRSAKHKQTRSWSFKCHDISVDTSNENDQANRAISTGKLHTLLRFHTRPINVVVFHDSQGILVSRSVSRLDAFSGYPFRI